MVSQRVVVVGGGFAGVLAVRGLRRADNLEVTLIDRQNFYLFQPLAYQVATGSLSPEEVAVPLRQIVRKQRNTRVILGEVTGFDLEGRNVIVDHLPNGAHGVELPYDVLLVAGGSRYSYVGHDEWSGRYTSAIASCSRSKQRKRRRMRLHATRG
jgi:NADH dehydrogenase